MKDFELDSFVVNARKTLTEAQVLCQEASMRIFDVKQKLSRWQQDVSKLKFMISCIQRQSDFLYKNVLKIGIGENLIKTEWSQIVLVDLIRSMKYWQNELSTRITRLDGINNGLISHSEHKEDDSPRNLGDFIPRENVHILDERLKEIPIIRRQIDNIKSQYANMVKKVSEQLMLTKLVNLESSFRKSFSLEVTGSREFGEEYLEEMTNLEHELVEYLNSLTDHFDKCQNLRNINSEKQINKDLLEIVTKDNAELSSVLDTLRDTVKDVDQIILKLTNTLEKKTMDIMSIHGTINKIINELCKHQEYLAIFKDISELISTFKETCLEEIQVTKELCEFYENFESSYYNLVAEAERRRSVAIEMSKIVSECEEKLRNLDTTDHKMREIFLEKNGNYLPETIWPGQIDDFSPLYSLQYSIKDV
ncbi:hypothetical protein HG535_0B06980 [Zygotorulaspora mrakii]|uniref:Autophagy-related protein 17 n=1 Tax=Zygotorulaspora mrakii TaxID=42260 RepID=A0A7H9B1K3_ZYGMR|nr:uncharacterized protein HG535_0B06980 [Zygotorulaspora mrakii]QLG71652.1 hypothetical protein HG535_0B06980 [Zygotorulaspora mrakii]